MKRIGFVLPGVLLLCLMLAASALAQVTVSSGKELPALGEGEKYIVYKIDLKEGIMADDVPFFIHRSVEAAKAQGAHVVLLDLDTPGGRVDLMMQIRDELVGLEMPTYSYINKNAISAGSLIAIAMDTIVMSPVSSIGGAQVITGSGQELPEKVESKMASILKGGVRSTAKYKGHPVRVCEAFVDADIEIRGLTPQGEVLTMDQEQATTFRATVNPSAETLTTKTLAAFIAVDVEDLLQQEGIWPAEVREYTMSWSEKLAKKLMAIRPLLLLVGLIALFIEVKSPGLGAPGAVGVVALALFFWGNYVADLASVIEMVLFVMGFLLLMIEILVIPGFGIAGFSGILLILVSLVLAMFKLPPPEIPDAQFNADMLARALWTVILVFFAMLPCMWILSKVLPSAPLFRNLILSPDEPEPQRAGGHPVGVTLKQPAGEVLLGKKGRAVTDLRPSGTAEVEGCRIDVLTEGAYTPAGASIKVIDVHGNVFTVAEVEKPAGETEA